MKAFVDSVLGAGKVELAGAKQGYIIQKLLRVYTNRQKKVRVFLYEENNREGIFIKLSK